MLILLILSLVIFVLQHVSTRRPGRAYLGANASPATVAAERQRLGLDDPLFTQYFALPRRRCSPGDLGRSLRTRQPVTADLGDLLPATVELVVAAFVLALLLAALFAFSGALRWPGASIGRGALLLSATAPPFLLALVGIIVFFGQLGWLPAPGRGNFEDPGPTGMQALDSLLHGQTDAFVEALQHLLLPALVLSIAPAIAIGRILRSSLQGVAARRPRPHGPLQGPDRAARSSRHHVVRNAIGPALSMAGLQLGVMFAGVVVVEQIFSWPGIGNYLAASHPGLRLPGDRRGDAGARRHLHPRPTSSSTCCRPSPTRGSPPNDYRPQRRSSASAVHRTKESPREHPTLAHARPASSPSAPR